MSAGWDFELLSRADIADNVALSNSVGWPDTESEWQLVYDAALVFGVRRAGKLVGQGALGLFDGAATIAKMVIAPECQRLGIGAAILDGLLARAAQRALPVIGLVATPAGQRLYVARGFEVVGEVVIALGNATLDSSAELIPKVSDVEQIAAIERRFMASARTRVLSGRLRDARASALLPGGFALATPAGAGFRVGPIVAEDDAVARSLTRALCSTLSGPIRVDVPAERREFRTWLQELGLVEKGVHLEMARGGSLPWNVPQRFGLATQAWG